MVAYLNKLSVRFLFGFCLVPTFFSVTFSVTAGKYSYIQVFN